MCSQVSRSALGKNSIKKEGGIHLARNNIRLKVKKKEVGGSDFLQHPHRSTNLFAVVQEQPRKAPYYPLPGSKPFSGFGFWPTFHAWPHLLDHDYMSTWFDPRPEMKGT